uniref:non-specific serine/threonine protein kinase n=1 Tax=Haptolina ericina TaxID=156174 RepID=A0A7S3BL87_9EUKA
MTKLQVGRFQLEEGAQLGAGGYGVVVKALDTQSGSIVAAKKIDKRKMKGDAIEREVMLMRMLNHPNVIAVLDQVEMDTTIFIFMELATKGELFGRVIQSGSLTEADARPYFTQLMNAVKFMHDKGVAHRDLKLENVLLLTGEAGSACKIIDWGLAHQHEMLPGGEVRSEMVHSRCGSRSYMAPEVVAAKDKTGRKGPGYEAFGADVWSLGVCMFAMLVGFFPFDRAEPESDWRARKCYEAQLSGLSTVDTIFSFYPRKKLSISPAAKRLLDSMLVFSPARRATMEEVLGSSWLAPTDVVQMRRQVRLGLAPLEREASGECDSTASSAPTSACPSQSSEKATGGSPTGAADSWATTAVGISLASARGLAGGNRRASDTASVSSAGSSVKRSVARLDKLVHVL